MCPSTSLYRAEGVSGGTYTQQSESDTATGSLSLTLCWVREYIREMLVMDAVGKVNTTALATTTAL